MLPTACPKPEPRKRQKARAQRAESQHAQRVRAACVERDGDCRLNDPALWPVFGQCSGESEWCHMPEYRRSKTRGLPAEARHTTAGSFMGCTFHHAAIDKRGPRRTWIRVDPTSSHGADGRLAFTRRETVYVEPAK